MARFCFEERGKSMDWIYLIGPAVGALIGSIYGKMLGSGALHGMRGSGIGSRVGGSPGWTYAFAVFGALWGLQLAANYRDDHKKGDNATGEFLTDTKEYKKRNKKDKADKKD